MEKPNRQNVTIILSGLAAGVSILVFQTFGWKTTALLDSLLVGVGFPILVGIINSYHEDNKEAIKRNEDRLISIEKSLESYHWQEQEAIRRIDRLEEILINNERRFLIIENKIDLYQQTQHDLSEVVNNLRVTIESCKFYYLKPPEETT